MNTITLKASQLRAGNIVRTHGMRVLLDHDVQSADRGGDYGPVFWCRGLVLNIAELSESDSDTDQWLGRMTREYKTWPERHVPTGEHRWTIQSNDLYIGWPVEIETLTAEQRDNLR